MMAINRRVWRFACLWLLWLLAWVPYAALGQPATIQPEAGTAWQASATQAEFERYAVVSANPLASAAGERVLRQGGSAMDAAIATQWVLALVEPQSSGVGGGGFILHFDGAKVSAIDGRETAPQTVTEELFLEQGQPMPFAQAMVGGRAVGVPGLVKALELAHRRHGRLPWATLFEPAIALATKGFLVSPRLHALLQKDRFLRQDPQAAALYYLANGNALPVGHRLVNTELAKVFKDLAQHGSVAFYEGARAQRMVQAVTGHGSNPGQLQTDDLSTYSPRTVAAMCFDYTSQLGQPYTICGMPPPSSGMLAVAQILKLAALAPRQATNKTHQWLHYLEASRLVFADRALYVADPDFVSAPAGDWLSLLNPRYLRHRASLIGSTAAEVVEAGDPAQWLSGQAETRQLAAMPAQPEYGTTHISVVDAQGQAVSLTSSIESAFGARLMVDGFLLNNQLTDFSFLPRDPKTQQPIANRVQAGKRPRSSMTPLMVWHRQTGHLAYVLGSPGGSMIIHYVARALQAMLDQNMAPGQAVMQRHMGVTTSRRVWVEQERFDPSELGALSALGYQPRTSSLTSGLHVLRRQTPQSPWVAGVDPRREGKAMGQ
jgi:gamma-glutamyltranspeptidase/glutathione hydrolase